MEAGPEGLPAGVVGERLGLPSPTLSFHLNQLRFTGLVTSQRESHSIIYSANFGTMNQFSASCSLHGVDLTSDVVPESVNRQSLCRQ